MFKHPGFCFFCLITLFSWAGSRIRLSAISERGDLLCWNGRLRRGSNIGSKRQCAIKEGYEK